MKHPYRTPADETSPLPPSKLPALKELEKSRELIEAVLKEIPFEGSVLENLKKLMNDELILEGTDCSGKIMRSCARCFYTSDPCYFPAGSAICYQCWWEDRRMT